MRPYQKQITDKYKQMNIHSNRRRFLQLIAATTGLTLASHISGCAQQSTTTTSTPSVTSKLNNLSVGGSPIVITILMAYLAKQSELLQEVEDINFRIWKTHDQLRADTVSGKLQVSATPTSLAANLYQKEVPVQLLNVLVWGVLYVLTTDQNINNWQDLKGKTILIAFRGGLPGQVFTYLAKENNLNPGTDIKIQYTTDFTQSVQLLLAGRGDVALLSEPAGTGAQLRGKQQGLQVRRMLNLQEEWGRVTGRKPRIPQAGTLALNSLINEHPDIIKTVQTELVAAVNWVKQNPDAAAELGSEYLGLKVPIIQQSLQYTPLEMVSAAEAKEDLEFWFKRLMEQNPKFLGGSLPDAGFYYGN